MPAPLPDVTATGYGFDIAPTGTQLAVAGAVRVKNWRNFPTTMTIPAGTFDETTGGWKHVDTATWDGSAWKYSLQHFCANDVNPNRFGELVLRTGQGRTRISRR
jgi:hypothetical protein